jgi:O-antigen/teichoic acid export membrane protein
VVDGDQAADLTGLGRLISTPGRRIGLAASTGAAAKVLSLVVQVVAVAVAFRVLKAEGFAVFVTIVSLVSWLSLASLGVAPGLTLGMARAASSADRVAQARLLVVSLILMAIVASSVAVVALVVGSTDALTGGLASRLGASGRDAAGALTLMILLVAAQIVLAVPEAAQLGLQSQHLTNAWNAAGSAVALGLLLTIGPSVSSIVGFVAISQGPQTVARALNGFSFVMSRPYLLRPRGLPFRALLPPILGSGLAFAGIQLASYVSLQVGLLILAAASDSAAIALAGLILRAVTLASGAVVLLTTPTWPAITDAAARGDRAWAIAAVRRMTLLTMVYAAAVALFVLVGAGWAFEAWSGRSIEVSLALRILLATYFVLGVWSHVSAIVLVGLGKLRFTALILLGEAFLIATLMVISIPAFGVIGYVGSLAVGTALVSAWLLPVRARRELSLIGP